MAELVYIYNTLTGKKELLEEKLNTKGKVHLYSCGPTVYDFAHIGNFRSFLMSDLLFRTLKLANYEVVKVQNITDVGHLTNDDFADADGEDKIAKKAKAEGVDAFAVAEKFTNYFLEDEAKLKISPPHHRPKATDFIQEQISLTEDLINKGFAYHVEGSVYFRATKFEDYGKLSKNNLEDLQAGARVEVNDEKENPLDFALWKKADENHLMQWDSPWGRGFPGWHIECSAMSHAILGYVDIHTGGEDNIFPHHECEIAQNECGCGMKIPYWMHAKHLLVDGQKMSKSKGNFFTIRDLLDKGWTGEEIRYALMTAHYRTAFNFTEKALEDARKSITKINETYQRVKNYEPAIGGIDGELHDNFSVNFNQALFDDLNVSEALGIVFLLLKYATHAVESKTLSSKARDNFLAFFETDFNNIFEVLDTEVKVAEIPEAVQKLIEARTVARSEKNWEESDRLRDEIKAFGYQVLDGAEGQNIKPL